MPNLKDEIDGLQDYMEHGGEVAPISDLLAQVLFAYEEQFPKGYCRKCDLTWILNDPENRIKKCNYCGSKLQVT